jgi:uncharacterized membrane protein YfcA
VGTIVLAVVLGATAGVVAGFFGVGGGILFVPTLALALGLSQLEAEATSLAAILPAVVAGAWQQQRYGNVRWRAAGIIGAASVIGVELGVRVAEALPEDALRQLFALLMFAVAGQLALQVLRS